MAALRRRLQVWLLIPLLVLSGAGSVIDYRIQADIAEAAYDDALGNTAKAIAVLIQREDGRPVLNLRPRTETALRTDRVDRIYFAVFRENGERLAGDAELPFVSVFGESQSSDQTIAGTEIRLIAVPYSIENDRLVIEVAETTGKRRSLQRRVALISAAWKVLTAMLVLLLVGFGISSGLKPLERLRMMVTSRPVRNLSPLPTGDVPDELRPLISALNRQIELLGESVSSQDRFLSDAAHQLKTPLAALQAQLELAASDNEPASRQRRLAEMEEATRRVGHLVRQLLAQARAESGMAATTQRQRVVLADIVEALARSHLDTAIQRNIDLGFELGAGAVHGVPWLLNELLVNLLDNALTYVPAGSSVTVRCGQRGEHYFLEVEDDGPGISQEFRGRVFERFFRAPGSTGEGCGLGLAIVQDIATAHGATVKISDGADGRGVCVTVLFPLTSGNESAANGAGSV
jgi:two-component system sensor histidine kinase TctE